MSQVKHEAIWQHDQVLPYILTTLKDKVEEITPVEKIFLFGSRSRVPLENWKELEGKDWDVLVQAKFKLKNAQVLVDKNYHLDLLVLDEEKIKTYYSNNLKMIYPENELKK
ncbi:hypothetical protein SAMN05443633_102458 [Chryseobacterium arachidis]|uniref:Nucleotidyltransferase domain-containing protein n=1 Tax=Chryseobacterium arachidis TaxID=1416778 RepID=A0A1M4XYB7_9FLAO|nr:hypothetical protein [Chryseobacterium arachidis]SHE98439.1 hypothetical protein SAMN05443633_102458 [Chryseobacterium arachidis]